MSKWHYAVAYTIGELLELELKVPLFFVCRFLYVEFGHHGSDCDGGIFQRSRLLEQLEDGTFPLPCPSNVGDEGQLPYFFVGDEAFPLKGFMMRPYPRRGNIPQKEMPY